MAIEQENDAAVLAGKVKETLKAQRRLMNVSLLNDWYWSVDDFDECREWLINHPRNIRKGTYMTRTPDKEVWRCMLPKGLGSYPVIYKFYDYIPKSLFNRIGASNAVNEAVNTYALREIGIPVSDVLACGEFRHAGLLINAYLIAKCADETYDGSVLTPRGILSDNKHLRFSFAKKAMQYIARAHRSGCYHGAYNAHKILFPKGGNVDDIDVIWADVSTCTFMSRKNIRALIPRDIVTLFIDMRFSMEEIKKLCNEYLQYNPDCGYSVPTLWEALTNVVQ